MKARWMCARLPTAFILKMLLLSVTLVGTGALPSEPGAVPKCYLTDINQCFVDLFTFLDVVLLWGSMLTTPFSSRELLLYLVVKMGTAEVLIEARKHCASLIYTFI